MNADNLDRLYAASSGAGAAGQRYQVLAALLDNQALLLAARDPLTEPDLLDAIAHCTRDAATLQALANNYLDTLPLSAGPRAAVTVALAVDLADLAARHTGDGAFDLAMRAALSTSQRTPPDVLVEIASAHDYLSCNRFPGRFWCGDHAAGLAAV